jgi:TP901 family phage tail tape measure protein
MSTKTMRASVIIGGSVSASLRGALSSVKTDLSKIGDAIGNVTRRQRLLGEGINTFARMGRNVDKMRQDYAALTVQADRLRLAQSRLLSVQSRLDANMTRRRALGGEMMGAVGTAAAVGAAIFQPVKAAVEFETAMQGIARQVNGAKDAAGNFLPAYFRMGAEIKKLGHELPLTTTEIADMVTAGARMGIQGEQNLITFTRNAAMMATAFEAPAGALAEQMGKISTLFGIPVPAIGDLADSINTLDDNAVAKGADIIDVLQRIGGMAKTVKMTAKDAAALGSTFLSLGSSAEVAGTASNAIMRILGTSDAAGKKRIYKALEMLKLDPAQIQSSMSKDATGTILRVMDALNKLPNEDRLVAATKLFGAEYGDDVAKLAGSVGEYRRQLELANGEKAKGSMSREFQTRMKSTAAQWQVMKNRVFEMAVNVGTALLPAINSLFTRLGPVVERFATWAQKNPQVVKGVVALAAGAAVLRVGLVGIAYGANLVNGAWLRGAALFARARAGWALASVRVLPMLGAAGEAAFGAIAAASAPVLLVVGAIAAVAVGAALVIRKYWQPIAAFVTGYADGIRTAMAPVFGQLKTALAPLVPLWNQLVSGLSAAWNWFVRLVAPVNMTAAEVAKATASGRSFGLVVGGVLSKVISGVVTVIGLWVKLGVGIANVAGTIMSAFGTALDWLQTKWGAVVGFMLRKMAPITGSLGFLAHVGQSMLGGDSAGAPAAPGRTAPALPASAGRNGRNAAGGAQSHVYHITQQPGESGEALARRIEEAHRRKAGVAQRGALADGAG